MKSKKSMIKTAASHVTVSGFTAEQLLSSDMLAYSGYKISKNGFTTTGTYNPIPYAGIANTDVQHRK